MCDPYIIQQFSTAGGSGDEIEKAQKAQKTSEPTIFSKIIDKTIPADIIYEDDQVETILLVRVVKISWISTFWSIFVSPAKEGWHIGIMTPAAAYQTGF